MAGGRSHRPAHNRGLFTRAQAGFIWDDDAHLTRNPCIIGPLGFKAIRTSSHAYYYPLVLTTFWILHKFVGLNPLPYHLLNVSFGPIFSYYMHNFSGLNCKLKRELHLSGTTAIKTSSRPAVSKRRHRPQKPPGDLHPSAPLIEFVALDDRVDVFAGVRKVDICEKIFL